MVDVDPASASYGQIVGRVDMPNAGDELHHFGWNACSSCLCPYSPHAHMERRYLVVPGLRSSRIHIIDTKPNPRAPKMVKVIEPGDDCEEDRLRRVHTSHCGPDGIYMNALGFTRRRRAGRNLQRSIRRRSRSAARGKRTAARSIWPTTSGGTWDTTP